MSTGWNHIEPNKELAYIINLLGNEYWLERAGNGSAYSVHYKPTGK